MASNAQGQSLMRVRFDFSNVLVDAVGSEHGLSVEALRGLADQSAEAARWLGQLRTAGKAEWLDLPYQRPVAERVVTAGEAIAKRCDNFVVLGIGGSALGTLALQTALHPPFYNHLDAAERGHRPRIYVLDNVDPDYVAGALDLLDLKRTIFNVVTKSGSTSETMAQLAIVRDRLRKTVGSTAAEHIIATTDPSVGDLRTLTEREGYQTFEIPKTVGGRFSVLSPVGLLPAAVSGVDVRALLAGAAEADRSCRSAELFANPALLSAAILFLFYQKGKSITVMMPYSQRLREVADWFRQLWAESLGKTKRADGQIEHVGLTPVAALGVTDQHSQVQLYMEGPSDKVLIFVGVDRFERVAEIPRTQLGLSSLDYLGGQSLNTLINAERLATTVALTAHGRPNYTILLPEVNAYTIGQVLYTLEVQTALIGRLLGIDPFDQPGVEAGKVATYALMGRHEYETDAAKITRQLQGKRWVL